MGGVCFGDTLEAIRNGEMSDASLKFSKMQGADISISPIIIRC